MEAPPATLRKCGGNVFLRFVAGTDCRIVRCRHSLRRTDTEGMNPEGGQPEGAANDGTVADAEYEEVK